MNHIDYITLVLNDSFSYREMYEYAREQVVDTATGEVLGIRLEPYLFSVNPHYGASVTVSFFKGAEHHGVTLALKHGLKVTRLDIACDLHVKNLATAYQKCAKQAQAESEANKNGASFALLIGKNKLENGRHGFRVGANSSDNQLRVYEKSKDKEGKEALRVEYQLRRDKAQAVFDAIKHDPDNSELIRYQIDACINRYHADYLPIKVDELAVLNLPSSVRKDGNTEVWVLGIVLNACIRHFDTYGVNLVEKLKVEFDRCYEERAYLTTVAFRERNAIKESIARFERQEGNVEAKFLEKVANKQALSKKRKDSKV